MDRQQRAEMRQQMKQEVRATGDGACGRETGRGTLETGRHQKQRSSRDEETERHRGNRDRGDKGTKRQRGSIEKETGNRDREIYSQRRRRDRETLERQGDRETAAACMQRVLGAKRGSLGLAAACCQLSRFELLLSELETEKDKRAWLLICEQYKSAKAPLNCPACKLHASCMQTACKLHAACGAGTCCWESLTSCC